MLQNKNRQPFEGFCVTKCDLWLYLIVVFCESVGLCSLAVTVLVLVKFFDGELHDKTRHLCVGIIIGPCRISAMTRARRVCLGAWVVFGV